MVSFLPKMSDNKEGDLQVTQFSKIIEHLHRLLEVDEKEIERRVSSSFYWF